MLSEIQKRKIADFMRKIADDIESNPDLEFAFEARGKRPVDVSVGLGGALTFDKYMKSDYEITISIKDWSAPQ